MGLQFTVTHLTRMRANRICVAGLTDGGMFVRPQTDGRLTRALVPGLFELGARVDLGAVRRQGHPPQTENISFDLSAAVKIDVASIQDLELLLTSSLSSDLSEAFGAAIDRTPSGAMYVAPGSGLASLGTVSVEPDDFRLTSSGSRVMAQWVDPVLGPCARAVTALDLFPDESGAPSRDAVVRLTNESRSCDALYLSVGLSSLFAPERGPSGHWVQVNNIICVRRPSAAESAAPRLDPRWPVHSPERIRELAARFPKVIADYPRTWTPWIPDEDQSLHRAFEAGSGVKTLAAIHQRNPGAIDSRLRRLGLK